MAEDVLRSRRIATTLSWPVAMGWTAWHYMWRILPVHRVDDAGNPGADLPPPLPPGVSDRELQAPDGGHGPLLHRVYWCTIADGRMGAEQLVAALAADPNRVAPWQVARFRKTRGEEGRMHVGDEFVVRMPGPWDGPVRTVEVRPDGFRFATLTGHLEAGQIEWRANNGPAGVTFTVESWARGGDRLSAFMHDRMRMAKEVQLYTWTSVLERVPRLAGGRLRDGVHVNTRRVPPEALE